MADETYDPRGMLKCMSWLDIGKALFKEVFGGSECISSEDREDSRKAAELLKDPEKSKQIFEAYFKAIADGDPSNDLAAAATILSAAGYGGEVSAEEQRTLEQLVKDGNAPYSRDKILCVAGEMAKIMRDPKAREVFAKNQLTQANETPLCIDNSRKPEQQR